MNMFYFAIPLRSKKSSNNWEVISKLFNNTIKSALNQTNKNFKIIVGCHDIPKMDIQDDRVEFCQVDFPEPTDFDQQMLDKFYKKRIIMSKIAAYGGGYTMFLDADDLVSCNMVEYVLNDDNKSGYYFPKGYEYDMSSNKIKKTPRFYNLCGSSFIIYFDKNELPNDFSFNGYEMGNNNREVKYFFDLGHSSWLESAEKYNKSFKAAKFCGAVYVINTGDNHSQLTDNIGVKRKILRFISRGHRPGLKLKSEFSIT